jgi:hypothetical protein
LPPPVGPSIVVVVAARLGHGFAQQPVEK